MPLMCSECYLLVEQMSASDADGDFPSIIFVRSLPSFIARGMF